jgi:hypothetical protein
MRLKALCQATTFFYKEIRGNENGLSIRVASSVELSRYLGKEEG